MNKYLLSLVTFLIPILNFAQETSEKGLDQQIDEAFKPFSDLISSIVFFEIFEGAPFVIILLVGSALFFSLYFGFPNFRSRLMRVLVDVKKSKQDRVICTAIEAESCAEDPVQVQSTNKTESPKAVF